LKATLSRKQEYREAQRLIQGQDTNANALNQEEACLREELAISTASYKTSYQELKELKLEIEHLQHLLETARLKLQKDFEVWLDTKWPDKQKSLPSLSVTTSSIYEGFQEEARKVPPRTVDLHKHFSDKRVPHDSHLGYANLPATIKQELLPSSSSIATLANTYEHQRSNQSLTTRNLMEVSSNNADT
jgi:hypothetical protein